MYGLVFEIVEEWVIEKQGIDVWHAIKEKARCQVRDQAFLRRSYYPDEELVDIVAAASEILGVQVPAILEAFGHYVIMHHYQNGYDELLRCQGSTLRQWLSNLNAMHDHVEKTFPGEKFSAPIFWCEDDEEVEGSILLHYYSLRGTLLVPMVVGIVEELATYEFKVDVKLNQLKLQDEDGAQFTTWRISAIDESQKWKLSPQDKKLDLTVDFDNVKMPNKCPYSGRTFSKTTADTTTNKECPHSSMSLDDDPDSCQDEDLKPAANKNLLGLTMRNLQTIFPFHVLVDRDFVVLQVGSSLPSLLNRNSTELTGQKIGAILEISRPVLGSAWDWKALSKLADQHFFLAPLSHQGATLHKKVSMADSAIKFKGSMIKIAGDKVMFVLCPDARNVGELNRMGLTMSDLPLISCQRDTVFLGEYITQEVDKAHELDKLSKKLKHEKNLSTALLYNMLPKQVADDLRDGKTAEPKHYEDVTLFFSDIQGFTNICDQVDPWAVIDLLNQLYTVMDHLASHFNLYKVETIGDAYMCCSGLPVPDKHHAENIANFAIAVVEAVKLVKSPVDGSPIQLRVGIHTGSCTAGVVGTLTPHFCLFGDMVNTTARHESTGEAGKVQCSSVLFGRLKHFSENEDVQYRFTPRGLVDMKGKGNAYTYWLEGGTEHNPDVNPKAIQVLVQEVGGVLAKRTWKMRRYFRRNGAMRGINDSMSDTSGTTASSAGTLSSGYSGGSTSDDEVGDDDDCDEPEYYSERDLDELDELIEEKKEEGSEPTTAWSSSSESPQEDKKDPLPAVESQWPTISWKKSSTRTGLVSRVHEILSSLLTNCIGSAGNLEELDRQLYDFINKLSEEYRNDNRFHSFRRACHIVLSVKYLTEWAGGFEDEPWNCFVVVFAALVAGLKHQGVSNAQLKLENHALSQMYGQIGVYQERHSAEMALDILSENFQKLYDAILRACPEFLQLVENAVLAMDRPSMELRMNKSMVGALTVPAKGNRQQFQTTDVRLELLMTVAEISHFTQHFDTFLDWNKLEFQEAMAASTEQRGVDPRQSWFELQIEFFKDTVLPLVDLCEMVVPKSCGLREGAERNLEKWELGGQLWTKRYHQGMPSFQIPIQVTPKSKSSWWQKLAFTKKSKRVPKKLIKPQ
jgi:guanylate cyclase soluble subunit beta